MDPNERLVELANPHSWFLTADNLHEQALTLYRLRGSSSIIRTDYRIGVTTTWEGTNKAVFLLGGFALENSIKAFLVYENPNWVSNGKLSKHLRSHNLTLLKNRSKLIPFKNRTAILRRFEDGLESWARYPCGLDILSSGEERNIQQNIWSGYLELMNSYRKRLMELLSAGWKGPHGFDGRWTFTEGY